ncbi:DNA polymerase III subunit gamma/tau [Sandaracinobacter neustonicus]|uniref:DNA polymerase III subunit gamma/tau n=1 Tax=Sandaracinobacter neustonicus TaxID=1715348 RepID=A0A501XGG7_9SPHN|nr:DNA polymerase III subunit gamma/tau [Sandaracinobacter neustonicus]TPE59555.1 DNA polymerase III subunit gamma/tau [Sandaracinobacter neustonicus]
MSLFPEDAPYRVLARKYRPSDFGALIGQDAVVTTLANAIRTNRLAQAWLLTGVRGVGKTSTARIIAKALNCIGPDGNGGPTIEPCGVCANCVAISAGQHIDVVEMDAASNTGVDNIREIIEAVRYASVSARYKVYIVDEVHMLSKGAFNALLKTLEEPPPHVKFIFATTEVQKVPATILSRCQRFDLKRVPVELLAEHFRKVAEAEGAAAEPEALALIARAAEGSVRDGLSILDQAIAQAGSGIVEAAAVRDMLGLADRGRIAALLGAILQADPQAALAAVDSAHGAGVDPQALISGLLDMLHQIVRSKMAGSTDPALPEGDRQAIQRWSTELSFPAMHRLWQLLLKGHAETGQAPQPQQAAEMAILRCVHAAGLPDPDRIAKLIESGAAVAPPSRPAADRAAPAPAPVASATALPQDAESIVALFENREAQLCRMLRDRVSISVQPDLLILGQLGDLPAGFAADVTKCLVEWTGQNWEVRIEAAAEGAESLYMIAERAKADAHERALEDPMVKALLAEFPGAELTEPKPPRAPALPQLRSATA